MTVPKPIVVSVDRAGTVSCDPSPKRKRKNTGTITWVLDPKAAGKFKFDDLKGLPQPTFSGKQVAARKITIVDDNQGPASPQDFEYQVTLQLTTGGLASPLGARKAVIRNEPG